MLPQTLLELYEALPRLRGVGLEGMTPGIEHEVILPYASYAPWRSDAAFKSVWMMIKDHTLVDRYRAYEVWDLAGQACRLSGDVIEVGVWRGGTAVLLALRAAAAGRRLYACDTFEGVVKAGAIDPLYNGGEHADTSLETFLALLVKAQIKNCSIAKGIFPDETGWHMAESTFCFAHIDVDVYRSAKECFAFIWQRLVVGGIVVFDDYGFSACEGVTVAVNELRHTLMEGVILHNLNGHAVIIKTGVAG